MNRNAGSVLKQTFVVTSHNKWTQEATVPYQKPLVRKGAQEAVPNQTLLSKGTQSNIVLSQKTLQSKEARWYSPFISPIVSLFKKDKTVVALPPRRYPLGVDIPVQLHELTMKIGDDPDFCALCTVHAVHTVDNNRPCIQLNLSLQPEERRRFTRVVLSLRFMKPESDESITITDYHPSSTDPECPAEVTMTKGSNFKAGVAVSQSPQVTLETDHRKNMEFRKADDPPIVAQGICNQNVIRWILEAKDHARSGIRNYTLKAMNVSLPIKAQLRLACKYKKSHTTEVPYRRPEEEDGFLELVFTLNDL